MPYLLDIFAKLRVLMGFKFYIKRNIMIDVSYKQTNKKTPYSKNNVSKSHFFLNFTAEETYKETYRI